MLNKQDIINIALVKVGNSPQSSIPASYLDSTFKNGKDYLLSQHLWTFAKTITQLSLSNDFSADSWKYAYRLPSNIGKIFDTSPHSTFDIYGNFLVSNTNPLSLIYTAVDIQDNYPHYFALAFGAYIAKEVALLIKADTTLNGLLIQDYINYLNDAINTDSAQITSLTFRSNRYIDIR